MQHLILWITFILCGFIMQDLLRLIDLCPFMASEKSQYNDAAVLNLLRQNPQAANLRHSFRCGIGNVNKAHPLALVVALGGSLKVVKTMVQACPEALWEKLSGKRNILHYAIAEGVNVEIIQYLTNQNPLLISEVDSFDAVPLHLAATYPSSSPAVLQHLLRVYPEGAKRVDYRFLTPLHRACKSRASLEMVLLLIETYPKALFMKDGGNTNDGGRNTPLGWAERMDHNLSDALPEVVQVLEMAEDILTMDMTTVNNNETTNGGLSVDDNANGSGISVESQFAQRILIRFLDISWRGGIRMAFALNANLVHLLDIPIGVLPHLLALIGRGDDKTGDDKSDKTEEPSLIFSMEGLFSVLKHCPDVVESAT